MRPGRIGFCIQHETRRYRPGVKYQILARGYGKAFGNDDRLYGGTKIGGSLQSFNERFGARLLSRNSVVIILSDGWDTETSDALVSELRKIKTRIKQLIWLNPLLGLPGYEPVTRGMSSALPYIDVFAPAHNLESLLHLERYFKVALLILC